mmetsp:Transcript_39398/g.47791  ORF Transcript_39398/g.47791 Transcript_39398/m.47791 type:complete len:111 (+) Transcript_39398:267-599(+)
MCLAIFHSLCPEDCPVPCGAIKAALPALSDPLVCLACVCFWTQRAVYFEVCKIPFASSIVKCQIILSTINLDFPTNNEWVGYYGWHEAAGSHWIVDRLIVLIAVRVVIWI